MVELDFFVKIAQPLESVIEELRERRVSAAAPEAELRFLRNERGR